MTSREYMAAVKQSHCVLCAALGQRQNGPTYAHHIREGQGISQRASDWLTVAVRRSCHRENLGIHGDRTLLKLAKVSELELLARTIAAVFCRCEL